ncbi:MAG: aminotransferase class I/II-fold pyridoxal phosphate-dependent enzyme [Phycisphaerales bacterium]|nr:aminotransferase class I/II-fold pyridoxal phosphate-dependent enzyme [Phycisphaerales bacterium]MCB9854246.1 aminotransferase class I/II-fold pyridoxal phosphate-dependent enzyme [Phycisphaerales bacterium]MCB9864746.1 aminotransferase class I/II-fold pyridoxal phosphate-dependent enzyme [Phycisphaerales bacterium]
MTAVWNAIEQDLKRLRDAGQFKTIKNLTRPMGPVSTIEGVGEVVVLCSNDYLGLANDPEVVEAATAAQRKWGAGTGSVRFICGTFDYHREIEASISKLSGTEASTTYVSCWNANEAVLPTLMAAGGDSVIAISDELNHASIIDAVRLGRQINKASKSKVYKHSDMAALEATLKESAGIEHKIVVTDGVFSMEGDVAHLDKMVPLCEQYGALLIVDDSHGVGVCGPRGLGVAEHQGVHGKIDCMTGTLGKALGGAAGGYIASRKPLVELMVQKSRPQLFSNALPPATAGAANKAIEILLRDTTRVDKLRANVQYMRAGLKSRGFETMDGPSAITPIILGETSKAIAASKRLLELGVFVIGFGYPVVPEGVARLRVQISAAHETSHLDRALDAFSKL